MAGKTALIAGATGLVGNELLHFLLNATEYEKVIAIVRRPLELSHPKLVETIVDFDQLEKFRENFIADDVFCCLGTTIKKAKTKEAMWKIDVEYPVEVARLASEQGASKLLLISSMNANSNSSVWYSKMKGMLEEEISKIPFETIAIFRPSLLLGDRKEFRLGEKIAAATITKTSFLFKGPLKKYKAIQAKTVASTMYKKAQETKPGISIYENQNLGA